MCGGRREPWPDLQPILSQEPGDYAPGFFFRCSRTYRRIARRYSSRVSLARSNPARCSIISSRKSAKYRRFFPDAILPRLDSSRCSSGGMVLNGRRFSVFMSVFISRAVLAMVNYQKNLVL